MRLVSFILFCTVVSTAFAKNHVINFNKTIESGDLQAMQKQITDFQIDAEDTLTVNLNSLGGLTGVALNIEAFLRWLNSKGVKIITKIESGAICASACVIVFSAGDERYAYDDSLFIFHGPQLNDLEGEEYESVWNLVVAAYLESIRRADDIFADYVDQNKLNQEGQTELTAAEIDLLAPGYLKVIGP